MKKLFLLLTILLTITVSTHAANYKQVGGGPRSLPQAWTFQDGSGTGNFDSYSTAVINAEGWYLVLDNPVFDAETEKLGDYVLTNDEWQKPVVALTAQEITDTSAAVLQAEREVMIVTPWQFSKAINAAGKRTEVEDALPLLTQDERDGWNRASQFERLDPLVITLGGTILGYNDTQLDSFFRTAAGL